MGMILRSLIESHDESNEYGKEVLKRRKEMRLSRNDLAKMTGICMATIANVETGRNIATPYTRLALDTVLKPVSDSDPYGVRLRKKRKQKGMSIEHVALTIGTQAKTITDIELGRSKPRKITHMKLVELLGEI